MEWEKPYLEALIDTLCPSGDVLQVGFSLGYAAAHIQTYHPKHHTIIESDPNIFEQALQWAKNRSNLTVIQGAWQSVLPELGSFDAIFFNDCSFMLETGTFQVQEMGRAALNSRRELESLVEDRIPQLNSMRYSDADLDAFYQESGRHHPYETARFLSELQAKGQISSEQYERMIDYYHLERITSHKKSPICTSIHRMKDNTLIFLDVCLKNHMRQEAVFSCFSSTPASKYDCPWFFEHIITNPDFEYQEKWMPVDVPKSCTYYAYDTALILTIKNVRQL
jgi:hypothetical protein